MAGSMESLSGPSYVSSHSADVILSDVRPIKLKLEALRSVNVLLDEFLYKILGSAGSLATDKLKSGLSKVLPTSLGKAAVLEAEVELKAYWERNTPHAPTKQDFDLQWSFALLRLKCEAYTTMNDLDEDEEAEKRLRDRMLNAGSTIPPHNSLVAPAALYLTAILEHVCEHILSNVGRVAARDSSRTVATVQDLFVALCEDASVYSMFKTMKVYDQIDALSKMQKPRRSKSMSKSIDRGSLASRAVSPPLTETMPSQSSASPPPRVRVSSDSIGSMAAGSTRSSHEKSRKKLFSRTVDQAWPSESVAEGQDDDARNGNSLEIMDEEALREFDELMQSGSTMKVSLTPDRLKSMEVYKQEKRRTKATAAENDQLAEVELSRGVSVRRVQARLVDSITEEEPIKAQPLGSAPNVITPRTRQTSLNVTSPPAPTSNPRTRSVTISAPQPPQRKQSQPPMPPPPQYAGVHTPKRQGSFPSMRSTQDVRPPRTRRVGRRRESMSLDEVMGDDDDTDILPQTPSSRRDPSKPYISKSARDLIDFLDEGPPMELQQPNRNASMISLESSKSRSGRLQRMMSKLTLGGSTEKLSGRADSIRSFRSPSSAVSSPPPSYMSPTSLRGPAVIVATPPPPPASLPLTVSLSSYMTQEQAESRPREREAVASPTPSNRTSITRKPVPAWDETLDTLGTPSLRTQQSSSTPPRGASPNEQAPNTPPRRASPNGKSSKRASPLDAFPQVPTTVNVNGVVHDSDSDLVRTASLVSPKPYTPARSEFAPSSPHPSMQAPPSPSPSPKRASTKSALSVATAPIVVVDDAAAEASRTSWPPTPPSSNPDVPMLDSAPAAPSNTSAIVVVDESSAPAVPPSTSEKAVAVDTPAFTAEQAQDLRRLLSVATTADECRLLVDMFMIKSGFSRPPAEEETPAPAASAEVEQVASKIETFNEDIERSLVALLLGDGESELDSAV